ncbi:restriction endonuclease subunit S [Faecalibacterium prausnitzii]|uniref:restriction endonuclease subunit S n=1 Tax=Faecalibacterium prausnitzii TaxID=853 RepID=UPI00210DBA23|nr:restriction endonuclease subunit S [Faecalibacterium prausnitzii]MCQ5176826.1 restriction endonuclease subunit S [Faecalibacterium prausnitzii]
MKSEWRTVALGSVADLTVGFVGTMASNYTETGIPFLRSTNIEPFDIKLDDIKYISSNFNESLRKSELHPNDVVIVRTGTPGACAVIPAGVKAWNCSDLVIVRPHRNKLNPLFLASYVNLASGVINTQLVGAVQQHYNVGAAKKMQIPLPPIGEQDKIASIIGMLNKKITINSKINDNLLEQIRTLCTAWLSDYKPFDGAVPSDWVETPLSDIAEFVSGYSYKGSELTDSTIAMATIKNFDRKGGFKLDGYKEIIPSSKLKESQHAELFDTLVAHTDLTQNAEVIGNAEPVMSKSGYDDIIFSMDLVKVLPKKENVSKFLLAAILQDKKFKAHCLGYVNGTTVLHLSKKALPEYKLFLPSDLSKLRPLDEIVTTLYKQISSNISENTYLEELRVALLPKLMSGELDVSGIDL